MNNGEIDEAIKLYFFNPEEGDEKYIEYYKKVQNEKYKRDKNHLYSPLYLILKDINYCLRGSKNKDRADRASVVLVCIAIEIVVENVFFDHKKGEWRLGEFAERYMNLNEEEAKAIRKLRNALSHNNYSTVYKDKSGRRELSFLITLNYIKKVIFQSKKDPSRYLVDPDKLRDSFVNAIEKYRNYLLKRESRKARKKFIRKFNSEIKDWEGIFIRKKEKNSLSSGIFLK